MHTVTNYSVIIPSIIPQLQYIDDVAIDSDICANVTNAMVLEAASNKLLDNSKGDTDRSRHGVPHTYHSHDIESIHDTGSELTHGSDIVMAGSVASAMRQRRNSSKIHHLADDSKSLKTSSLDMFDAVFNDADKNSLN